MELALSGYCRAQDQARMVFCETYPAANGEMVHEIDCDYPQCAYHAACQIGTQIEAWICEQEGHV